MSEFKSNAEIETAAETATETAAVSTTDTQEPNSVAQRYARRAKNTRLRGLYHPLHADVYLTQQERQRAMLRLFSRLGWADFSAHRVLEVGCGSGGNLLELLRLGFAPEHLSGIELLPERCAQAQRVLPPAVALKTGDALQLQLAPASQDVVLVSTVFSSLLDDIFQAKLAHAMWQWVRPGGGVLWYDFTVNNPRNPDVRGVPLQRIQTLFPQSRVQHQRVTLAPPLARAVCRVHPSLYTLFNTVPWLRTHVLAWVEKPQLLGQTLD
jgi:SAM-dependent methyltransferase